MPALQSTIDNRSTEFTDNRQAMQALVDKLRGVQGKVRETEQKKRDKFAKRGQILPRERVARVMDRGSPFLELCSLAGYLQHDDKDGSMAGGNTIAGIGYVSGVRCLITASNSAIKGGTISPWGLHKSLRLQEIALQNKLPVVSLVESGGANLLYASEIFVEGGRAFANQARLSAAGIPQITVVHGSSTAGGAYMPGLSDYVVMVRKNAKVFLAGPPLLKAATGEIAGDEELGGAEMHSYTAGTSEHLAENDADGLQLARQIVGKLGWNDNIPKPIAASFAEPLFPTEELAGLVPTDYRKPFDCRDVIARMVDGSDFLEFKAPYDQQTICGQASIHGYKLGIISNNGPITTAGATKAGQFIQLCNQSNTPILYLQNTTGYMVGTHAEQGGIVKHGSKMIQAVANSKVPQITLVMGGSFGAGNYGMCGRGFSPHFIFAWPNSRTSVMGGEQAAKVMEIVTEEKMTKAGLPIPHDDIAAMSKAIIDQFDKDSDAFNGTARLWDDGLIDPRDSRKLMGYLLSVVSESEQRQLYPNSFGVARF